MRTMDFAVGIHNRWKNVTVRNGYKWSNLVIGEGIRLTTNLKENEPPYDEAFITSVTTKRFCDIKQHELRKEHNPTCRTRTGLLREMKKIYPGFSNTDVVAIVEYQVDKGAVRKRRDR